MDILSCSLNLFAGDFLPYVDPSFKTSSTIICYRERYFELLGNSVKVTVCSREVSQVSLLALLARVRPVSVTLQTQ